MASNNSSQWFKKKQNVHESVFEYIKQLDAAQAHIQMDNIRNMRLYGNHDYMGIVVSKQALDYKALNDAINKSGASTYAEKLNEAISANAITNVNFSATGNGMINFKAGVNDQKNVVGCVVQIDKQ